MSKYAPELKMYEDFYRDKDHSSITELSRALQNEAPWLSTYVTHLAYNSAEYGRKNFPMLAATEGAGNKSITTVKLQNANHEYKIPVIGRPKKTSVVLKSVYTSNSDRAGVGGTPFKVVFADRWFYRSQVLYPPHTNKALQCQVVSEPVPVGTGWEYTLQIWSKSSTLYMPYSCLKAGAVWGGGVAKVGFEDSKGVESKSYLPGATTNMLSLTRTSYKFKGNLGKKIMMFEIPVDGKVFKTYMDWEIYLANLYYREQCETDLWFSRYGKTATGEMIMIDNETQVPITSGAGLDQQIPPSNADTYSTLTYNKFYNVVREITYNITDALPKIAIWTGRGGMEYFDRMIKTELQGFTQYIPSTQFTTGQAPSYNMTYGSFFTSFRHVDGFEMEVHYHPMFDRGITSEGMPLHPQSGLPLPSHDYYFIDMSTYDGKSNIQYVIEEGRQYSVLVKGAVPPTSIPAGYSSTDFASSDRDRASIETFKSQGIQIMRPSSCFKLQCAAGQV